MRILITGGAGYVGFSLTRALASRSDIESITIIDNLSRRNYAFFVSGKHGEVPVDFRRIEMLDGYSLEGIMSNTDVVFHLAGYASTPQADTHHHVFDQVNNWGTAQLARSIEKSDTLRQIVYLSSFAVYGSSQDPITDSSEPAPSSTYGVSKLAGEAHLRRLDRDGRKVQILRAGNVYGFNPAIRFDAVVNAMSFDACTTGKVSIHGDGAQQRPFIDVSSLANILASLVGSDLGSGTWNVANHNASISEIANELFELIPQLEIIDTPRIKPSTMHMGNPGAFSKLLGTPITPLSQELSLLVSSLRS